MTQDALDGSSGVSSGGSSSSSNAAPSRPVLDGYLVTSHSSDHAIIRGPVGSRIVTNGKTTLIGGVEWDVDITENGVQLKSGQSIILLVFDRSLSNVTRSSGSSTQNSGGTRE